MSDRTSAVGYGGEAREGRARDIERENGEEQAERFARALLPHIAPPPNSILGTPPGGWRASDGALTPPSSSAISANSAADANAVEGSAERKERVVLSVESSDLGELSLVLDRTATGIRVVIGLSREGAAGLIVPEREALLSRLAQHGVRVESVQIVAQRELGTLLAPARNAGRHPASSASPQTESREERSNRGRASRKLNLIG